MRLLKKIIRKAAVLLLKVEGYENLIRQYGYYLNILRWQYSREYLVDRRKLYELRNKYEGKRCFIIGNGPSITISDLKKLKNEITIGCNGLFLIFDQIGYLPTFYTVEDNLVAEDRAAIINSISGTTKIFPRILSYCLSKDQYTTYINFIYDYEGFPKFSGKFVKVVYWGGTVTYLNLQLAYFIGCKQIYLIGVDHNYEIPTNMDPNEDAVIVSGSDDVNHFHPGYFGTGYRYHNPKVNRMEEAYREAARFTSQHGVKIFNATRGGKLETFPRVNLDDLF